MAAVYVANALAHELIGEGPSAEESLSTEVLGDLAERLPQWRVLCQENLAQTQDAAEEQASANA